MCEMSLEESNMFDNEVCDFLDVIMGVVVDFVFMFVNGIYLFSCFCYCFNFILNFIVVYVSFNWNYLGLYMLLESVGRREVYF